MSQFNFEFIETSYDIADSEIKIMAVFKSRNGGNNVACASIYAPKPVPPSIISDALRGLAAEIDRSFPDGK
jgi:hypothetical protein